MYKYFITYKKLGSGFPDKSDYMICETLLRKHGNIKFHVFEHDSQGKLHVHFIYEYSKNGIYYKKFSIPGFHHFIERIYNESRLWNYLQKEDRNWFRTHFAFEHEHPLLDLTPEEGSEIPTPPDDIKEYLDMLPKGYDIW